MDRKHLEAVFTVEQMREAETSGGFYSADVQHHTERLLNDRTAEERQELYERIFEEVWSIANELTDGPMYDNGTNTLDLSQARLGKFEIKTEYFDDTEVLGDDLPYRSIRIVPRGLETRGIFLSDGGAAVEGSTQIDNFLLPQILDYIETLDTIKDALPNHVNR